ncbi:MAG: T9SS C-terminal target domain-containing protein [Calditrichaeota bacterium]|nr:MAG: T9SS C-terminal target domain-containing protein [Calditrichota bacterium]MBL1207049.1 T9SS C-terminal target domain-containing protein [Calditrichota bacterium]NOG46877.1 T9SS type A sorting domain-containing protein [Calditrichota bacterium]
MITSIFAIWDSNFETWVNYARNINSFDENENKLIELYENWNIDDNTWIYDYRYTFTYFQDGNRKNYLLEFWDNNSGIWVNNSRWSYTYDGFANRLTAFNEDWDSNNGIWVNDFRQTYTYDSFGNVLITLSEVWDNNVETWLNEWHRNYTYDENNNLVLFENEFWSGDNWYAYIGQCYFINNDNEFIYLTEELSAYYSTVTSIDVPVNDLTYNFSLSQNYPNPFNPSTTINYQLKTKSYVQLTVYDISGRQIKKIVDQHQNIGHYSVTFDASNLTSGIYVYRLKSGLYEQSRKMILIH